MGKKKQKDEAKEKPIFGSGAEPQPEPKDDGLVACVCTVACAWRGYHDEGDRVMVERELLEGDPFFKGHFKPLEAQSGGQRRQDVEGNGNEASTDAEGEGENAEGEGQGENAEGEGENGQCELGLK